MIPSPTPEPTQRSISPALLFVLSSMWIVVSLAGGRLAGTLASATWYDLSRELCTAVMLFAGFYLLARFGIQDLRPLSSVGFVKRPGVAKEFGLGAALGWAIALALVLPAALSRNTTFGFLADLAAFQQVLISMAVLAAFVLVVQLVLSGLPVRLLVRSIGTSRTVVAVVLLGAFVVLSSGAGQGRGFLFTALALCLSLFAFLRTRAIWLPLGLQLGFSGSLQLLFGAPSPYTPPTSGMVRNDTGGSVWLTGGSFGPEASTVAIFVLLIALLVLFRLTKDYAWHYTYQPVMPAGYPVDVPPPAAHVKEAATEASVAPLVQIGGITPAQPLSPPTSELQ